MDLKLNIIISIYKFTTAAIATTMQKNYSVCCKKRNLLNC